MYVNLTYFQNAFWKVKNLDPHMALLFDWLHTFPGGLFWDHIWKALQAHVTELGREASVEINEAYTFLFLLTLLITHRTLRAEGVPQWSGLDHFSNYIRENFTDGSKWENMSKVRYTNTIIPLPTYKSCSVFLSQICVHVAQNTLTSGLESDSSFLLLQCIQVYVELDLLASFEVHTDHTITWGRDVLKCFAESAMVRYITFSPHHGNLYSRGPIGI